MEEIITLDYGSGGLRTSQLIESVLVPAFHNPTLEDLGDGAVLPTMDGPLVYSTDSFVVTPWRFPGGDIGKLAVCGTVNDVCMAGGQPKYLSLSFIIEEGFLMEDFKAIVDSIATTAQLRLSRGIQKWSNVGRATASISTRPASVHSGQRGCPAKPSVPGMRCWSAGASAATVRPF